MKKNVLALLIASSIGLYGCGDDSELSGNPTIDPSIKNSLSEATIIDFDLISKEKKIITPSFLVMDSFDGTLKTDGESTDPEKYSKDISEPAIALGKTDGWSTTQPIVINFTDNKKYNLTGSDLEPSTAVNGFYLIKSRNPTDPLSTEQPEMLSVEDHDFVVKTSGKTLTVVLLKPLDPASNYMFAVTNDLKDTKGHSVGMSGSYGTLKATAHPPSEALVPAQKIVHNTEKEFEKVGVDPSSIIYSSWFTTQSVGDTLFTTKAAIAKGLANNNIGSIWKGDAKPQDVDLSSAYTITQSSTEDFAVALNSDSAFDEFIDKDGTKKPLILAAYSQALKDANDEQDKIDTTLPDITSLVEVTKGTVKLPYFLDKGDKWDSTPFESATPSLAKVLNILKTPESADAQAIIKQLSELDTPVDITQLATSQDEQMKLVGITLTDANGNQLDEERLVTRYSPLPKIKSLEDVNFLLFTPTIATAGKTPVVIYQHGITSVKENSYAFAANLAAKGIAVIAIDNPLHGERSLDEERSANKDIKAYLNLGNLTVGRDNIRQSMLDILGLRAALSVTAQHPQLKHQDGIAKLNPADTSFLGHSLGGIVGAPAVVAANRTLDNARGDAMFNFTKSAFANSGSDIINLLFGSEEFGSLIKHNLMLSESKDYQKHYATNCTSHDTEGWENTCFDNFYTYAPAKDKAKMDYTFAQYAYAAQTILGTAEPINAAWMAANYQDSQGNQAPILANHSMYMLQVSGDDTVPNHVRIDEKDPRTTYPFTGSEQMATFFGLSSFTAPTTTGKLFAKFKSSAEGQHSTFISPVNEDMSDLAAHKEMQSQIIQFFTPATGGNVLNVTDGFLEN